MKAILHIGYPKTGTTTIQDFLEANRVNLFNQGCYVPAYNRWPTLPEGYFEHAGHLPLVYASYDLSEPNPYIDFLLRLSGINGSDRNPEALAAPWSRLRKEIDEKRNDADTVIFTSEVISLLSETSVSRMADILHEMFGEIHVVVYLRRQVEAIISSYAQIHKMGLVFPTFDSYLKIQREVVDHHVMNYRRTLGIWSRYFSKENIRPRLFSRDKMIDNDLLVDFSQTTGLDASTLVRVGAANTALPAEVIEFCRLLNKSRSAFFPDGRVDTVRFALARALEKNFSAMGNRGVTPTRAQVREIIDMYRESNNAVAREYFGTETLFDEDCSQYPEEPAGETLNVESCIEIAVKLFEGRP